MKEYNLVLPEFQTQAGEFSIIEEITQQRSQRYYALEVSRQFDQSQLRVEIDKKNRKLFEENKCFRLYEQMITFNNKTQYLFKYVEGKPQSIKQLIQKTKNNLQSVPIEKINILLAQVLECLYQLHKLNILGRQFSTHNILECDGRVIMMDFGFCPALLESDFSYLFPPELDYISQKNTSFQNLEVYTSKLDSWLLGAFLYHLVKLNPISKAERNSTHILAHTERYQGLGICEFLQQLLVFNSRDRLSFFDIYNSNYVQRLQLQRPISEYLIFYQGFANSQPLIENIITRDYSFLESFFDSGHIIINQSQIQGQLELMSLDFTNPNQPSIQVDAESSELPNSDLRSVTNEFFFKPHSIQTSKYFKFWYFINYQQYRCYFLLNTIDEIVNKLADKNLEVEILASYIFQKMCYLILVELIAQLQSIQCPWGDDEKLWEEFQNQNQFILLTQALQEKKQKLQITLKSLFLNRCQRYVNDQRLDKQLRNSLVNDLASDFSYGKTSEDFLRSGFRQMTICIFNFLMNICNLFEDLRLTQYTLILKVVCCHLINRIFTIELQTNFQNLRPQYGPQLLPDDINDFISHQNLKREKIRQIQYLLDLHFYRREQR